MTINKKFHKEKDLKNECKYSLSCCEKRDTGKSFCPFHASEKRRKGKERKDLRRDEKTRSGLCMKHKCNSERKDGTKFCEIHFLEQKTKRKEKRIDKNSNGLCTEPHCKEKSIENRSLCIIHFWKRKAKRILGSNKHYKILIDMYEKQDFRCEYSKVLFSDNLEIAIDHKVPQCRGWQNGGFSYKDVRAKKCTLEQLVDNLCICENSINRMKNNKTVQEFKKYLRDNGIHFKNNPDFTKE